MSAIAEGISFLGLTAVGRASDESTPHAKSMNSDSGIQRVNQGWNLAWVESEVVLGCWSVVEHIGDFGVDGKDGKECRSPLAVNLTSFSHRVSFLIVRSKFGNVGSISNIVR